MTTSDSGRYVKRRRLRIVPLTMTEANRVVMRLHRHHGEAMALSPAFAIGCITDDGRLCGAAITGRPINRHNDDGSTTEVLRLASDGTANAGSALLNGCVRVARDMGFARLITYTLEHEGGASLRGAGWDACGLAKKTEWHRDYPSNQTKNRGNYRNHADVRKHRWEVRIREPRMIHDADLLTIAEPQSDQLSLLAEGVGETTPASSRDVPVRCRPSALEIPWGFESDESRLTEREIDRAR